MIEKPNLVPCPYFKSVKGLWPSGICTRLGYSLEVRNGVPNTDLRCSQETGIIPDDHCNIPKGSITVEAPKLVVVKGTGGLVYMKSSDYII